MAAIGHLRLPPIRRIHIQTHLQTCNRSSKEGGAAAEGKQDRIYGQTESSLDQSILDTNMQICETLK